MSWTLARSKPKKSYTFLLFHPPLLDSHLHLVPPLNKFTRGFPYPCIRIHDQSKRSKIPSEFHQLCPAHLQAEDVIQLAFDGILRKKTFLLYLLLATLPCSKMSNSFSVDIAFDQGMRQTLVICTNKTTLKYSTSQKKISI
jgi:hypothetical protein